MADFGISGNTNNEMKTRYAKVLQENMAQKEKNYAVKNGYESPKPKASSSSISYATIEEYKKLESILNQDKMMDEV